MGYRLGIDIGGTFTDFVAIDEQGAVTLWKEDSTPADPKAAIERGLAAMAGELGMPLDELLSSADAFVHGSTIATNTLIVRNGGPVGLVCTEGFRDVLLFRDGFKPERFNVHLKRPADFVDRYLRIGVPERINVDGEVLRELDEDAVRAAAQRFREADVKAVAVAFLWSVVNGDHERRAAEILREELPDVPVFCSKDVLNEIREWERTSATVLSAYVLPKIGDYLQRLEAFLGDHRLAHPAQYMQINGGCASVDEIMQRPVNTLHSGPAAAPAAAAYHLDAAARSGDGSGNVITVDMGGTSFDVCLIREGRPAMSRAIQVEFQPIGVSGVEVHSIGAGGGSIAWIDAGGALRVGPQSAGATPGPACYGAGGEQPTVTDANVVLGYLAPEAFLGGRRRLRDDLSAAAVASRVGDALGMEPLQAAAGIIEVVNANMVGGIRSVSVERGIDPRGFMLVSGGGAGGLHAARLARQLGMGKVMIPAEASTFCAFGMTVTDVRHDYTISRHAISSDLDVASLDGPFAELEQRARQRLLDDGFDASQIRLERSVDARYRNQVHELTIPIPGGDGYGPDDLAEIVRRFHAEHEKQFTYSLEDVPVEFLHWRLAAFAVTPAVARPEAPPADDPEAAGQAALIGHREAYFPEHGGKVETPVYATGSLVPRARVHGHAIIESPTTTVVINPGDQLDVLEGGRLLVTVATG
ncbi:hydantoinase/oxoprolinase family protein [Patulibacter defluvii]|uniref:hydantoinase/oxoprolinase family protein n=1 Tax=Patulibacter defluvii TaxID=3095358 RepID=UPI002A74D6F9|nr:hydantoinase/oxoprolinase family protein [Patulibacter sp. DM4]